MNLVILCGCGPINTCLINLIAKQHPVRHAFRVVWVHDGRTESRWSKLVHSPIRTLRTAMRHRFHNWLDGRIEAQAANHLIARGISPDCNAPSSTIDQIRINTKEFAQSLQALETDVLLTSACPLLKPEIFQIPRLATINIHRGIAPAYRGQRTIFWPLYFEDFEYVGITLHLIDDGVDTGPILAHGFPELCPADSQATILAKSMEMAANLLCKLLVGEKVGRSCGLQQTDDGRNFRCSDERIWMDLSYLFLRAVGHRPIPCRPARVDLHCDPECIAAES